MALNEAERVRLVERLEDFHLNGLLQYRWLAIEIVEERNTKEQWEEFQRLRLNLLRLYGGLEDAIAEYGGRLNMSISGKDYEVFGLALGPATPGDQTITALDGAILAVNKAIGKLQSLPSTRVESQDTETTQPPKAFIAHGGDTPALSKLKQFIAALGVIPIIAEEQSSEDRSINKQVDWCLDQCDCAIILATKGDIDGKTGEFIPRGNILIEIGKCQERFHGRIVYLIEQGTKFPTNISEKVRARFSPQSMDRAFTKVAKELVAFGIIRAVKP
jgi:predicted nucleotide-binding protein